MKYHIDTIPVWDALHTDSECLLCALKRKTERLLVERSLGASVMSPDTRLKVNQKGFCSHHSAQMYNLKETNRLGHALMMLSHLQTLRPQVEKANAQLVKAETKQGFSLFKKESSPGNKTDSALAQLARGCLLCQELEEQTKRQAASLLHLYKTDPAFREAFAKSKGLCIPHTAEVTMMAGEILKNEQEEAFIALVRNLLNESLARLEKELDWFTQKFDHRNARASWGTSRDALERTINKLRGFSLGSEPMQDV